MGQASHLRFKHNAKIWGSQRTNDPSHTVPRISDGSFTQTCLAESLAIYPVKNLWRAIFRQWRLEETYHLLSLPFPTPRIWAPGCIFVPTLQCFWSSTLLTWFLLGTISSLDPWLYSPYFSYLCVPQTVACPWFDVSCSSPFTISLNPFKSFLSTVPACCAYNPVVTAFTYMLITRDKIQLTFSF